MPHWSLPLAPLPCIANLGLEHGCQQQCFPGLCEGQRGIPDVGQAQEPRHQAWCHVSQLAQAL